MFYTVVKRDRLAGIFQWFTVKADTVDVVLFVDLDAVCFSRLQDLF